MKGPRFVPVHEELMLGAAGTLQPEVDRIGGVGPGSVRSSSGSRPLFGRVGRVYDERFG
jgi:hypothetical protein